MGNPANENKFEE